MPNSELAAFLKFRLHALGILHLDPGIVVDSAVRQCADEHQAASFQAIFPSGFGPLRIEL
jgi:hypothetical protein